jgi:hypothetical protein
LRDLLLTQTRYRLVERRDLPEHGCKVYVFAAKDRRVQK